MTVEQELAYVKEELEKAQVSSFTNQEACELGMKMYQKAVANGKSITISITKNDQQIFYASLDGTSKFNDDWIRRKENTTLHFCKSSYEVKLEALKRGDDIWERIGLDKRDYAQHGGSVPVIVKGVGMVGTVTVSGMTDLEDHEYAVAALQSLNK